MFVEAGFDCARDDEHTLVGASRRWLNVILSHPYGSLTILYLLSVLIHSFFLLRISILPSIMADEMMYFNLAESLYSGGGISVRGQPIVYPYILYPLLISPVFALPDSFNAYHAVVLLNCVAINAIIFPIYALGAEITRKRGYAFAIACVTLLLPDFFMAKHVMAESFAYPLLAVVMLIAYKELRSPNNIAREIALGLLFIALYALKPGYIAIAVAYIGVSAVVCLKGKDRRRLRALIITALVMIAVFILFRILVVRVLGVNLSNESQYSAQTAPFTLSHIWQTIRGALPYIGYILIGFGIIPVSATIGALKHESGERKWFAWMLLIALVIIIIGCTYVVFMSEYVENNNVPLRIHTRYVSFLLPLFLMFIPVQADSKKPALLSLGALIMLCAVSFIAFPPDLLKGGIRYCVDAALLSALSKFADNGIGLIYIAGVIACVTALGIWVLLRGVNDKNKIACAAFIALLLLTNKAFMYRQDQYAMNIALNRDAAQASLMTGNDAVYLCGDADELDYAVIALEVNSRCEIQPVAVSAMLNATDETGAVDDILPRPLSQYIYTQAVNAYDRPQYIIIKRELMYDMVLDKSVSVIDNTYYGYYCIARINEGGKWLHSGLFGLSSKYVVGGSRFLLYDAQLLNKGEVTLYLKAQAAQAGAELILRTDDGQTFSFQPSADALEWISVNISVSDPTEGLCVYLERENGDIYIETYLIE